jgi:hypothetical protein
MLRPPLESHDISRNVRDNLEATAEPMHARSYIELSTVDKPLGQKGSP